VVVGQQLRMEMEKVVVVDLQLCMRRRNLETLGRAARAWDLGDLYYRQLNADRC
jgi:hypothetical protein